MRLLKNMDLYKGVILASVLLLPLAGLWIKGSREGIQAAQRAINDATRSGGVIESVAELQRKVEVVEANKLVADDATRDPETYIQNQIWQSDKNHTLEKNDMLIEKREEIAFTGSSKQRATDHIVKVTFTKKDLLLPRDFLFAMLFNCESGARGTGAQLSSIWKLRGLGFQNASVKDVFAQRRTPPAEFEDRWIVKDLQFARRVPSKDKK